MTFLSTPSARRATRSCTGRAAHRPFLSTPSARRATVALCHLVFSFGISIHALREEGDRSPVSLRHAQSLFLSTPSARRATIPTHQEKEDPQISIHALREEGDAKTETKSLFSYKLYNILHEFRRALIYNGSKNYPNHAKQLKNLVRRCRKNAENSLFAPGRETQNNSRPSCSKGG